MAHADQHPDPDESDTPGDRSRSALKPLAGSEETPVSILKGVVAALRRGAMPLLAWVLLWLAAGAWYLHFTPPSYTASATIILDPKRPTTPTGAAAALAPGLDVAAAESQIQVIQSEQLLSLVFDALHLADTSDLSPRAPRLTRRVVDAVAALFRSPRSGGSGTDLRRATAYDDFRGRFVVRRVPSTYVIEVSYTSGDPDEARRLVNAVVSGYLGQQVSFKLAAAQSGAEYLKGRRKVLGDEIAAADAGMMAGTAPAAPLPDADARIIGDAVKPLGPSAPKSGIVMAAALVLGLQSGLFAMSVLNSLDRRVRTVSQLERITGLPCLGVIPDAGRRGIRVRRVVPDMARLARRDPDGLFAMAVRDMRSSILLALDRARGGTLGFTSWREGAGCSLLAVNFAQVIAMSGSHLTLVDADIRGSDGGLTALGAPVAVSLTETLLDPTGTVMSEVVEFDDGLDLIPARSAGGAICTDAYLGAPGLLRLVQTWKARGKIVVDLPPLSAGGDARAAAARLDGVVIVVEARHTTTDDVERAIDALVRAGASVIGTVLNRAEV